MQIHLAGDQDASQRTRVNSDLCVGVRQPRNGNPEWVSSNSSGQSQEGSKHKTRKN
jgi:hypothetical protein